MILEKQNKEKQQMNKLTPPPKKPLQFFFYQLEIRKFC